MPATVIVGAQWGDEGKGKIVDLLAQHSDLVCRYNGGPNAGHTIVVDGETFKLKHIPSGILQGKECVIGAGCVVDPQVMIEELDGLEARMVGAFDLRRKRPLADPSDVCLGDADDRIDAGRADAGADRRAAGHRG